MANGLVDGCDTRDLRPEQREAVWRQVLAQWRHSGLTQKAFCAQRGLSVSMLRWWKGELKRRGVEPAPEPAAGPPGHDAGSAPPGFAPVRLVDTRPSMAAEDGGGPAAPAAGLEVLLGNGRRLRVGPEVDGALLARVVAVLEGLPW